MAHSARSTRRVATAAVVALIAGLLLPAMPATAQLRVVSYNVAQLNGDLNALEDVFAALADDDLPGYAVAPAVIVFQEVQSNDTGTLLSRLNAGAPPGVSYVLGTYTNNNENGVAGAQAMAYRPDVVQELSGGHDDMFTGAGRNTDRWQLQLVGYTSPEASFYIYSSHLKASQGSSNQQQRLDGAETVRANADALGSNVHIIYAGDFNVYSNNEPAYLEFLSGGPGQGLDPLGTGGWSGSFGAAKHTQSPCNGSCPLVPGGMDDRFDFQLSTSALNDFEGLSIVPASVPNRYRAMGNDGEHYDTSINAGNNFYFPGELTRSNLLADDLYFASDHLPVIVEYQVPAILDASMPTTFGPVIEGAAVTLNVAVENIANVVHPAGADELDYDVAAFPPLAGGCSGSVQALDGADLCAVTVDTSVPGSILGAAIVTSTSEAVQNSNVLLSVSGTVLTSSRPSLDDAVEESAGAAGCLHEPDTGVVVIEVPVYNLGYDASQARLDLDDVTGVSAPFSFIGGLDTGIGATPATLSFGFDTTGLAPAQYQQVVIIETSDEDLPGAQSSTLQLTLTADVQSSCPGDGNGDGAIDVEDVLALINAWGTVGSVDTDLDGNGIVDVDDLLALINGWGPCPGT